MNINPLVIFVLSCFQMVLGLKPEVASVEAIPLKIHVDDSAMQVIAVVVSFKNSVFFPNYVQAGFCDMIAAEQSNKQYNNSQYFFISPTETSSCATIPTRDPNSNPGNGGPDFNPNDPKGGSGSPPGSKSFDSGPPEPTHFWVPDESPPAQSWDPYDSASYDPSAPTSWEEVSSDDQPVPTDMGKATDYSYSYSDETTSSSSAGGNALRQEVGPIKVGPPQTFSGEQGPVSGGPPVPGMDTQPTRTDDIFPAVSGLDREKNPMPTIFDKPGAATEDRETSPMFTPVDNPAYQKITNISSCEWLMMSMISSVGGKYCIYYLTQGMDELLPFEMSCDNQTYIPPGKAFSEGPPPILFGAYTENFVVSVMKNFLPTNYTIAAQPYDPKKMIVMFIHTLEESDGKEAGKMSNTGVQDFEQKFKNDRCVLKVKSMFASSATPPIELNDELTVVPDTKQTKLAGQFRMKKWSLECDAAKLNVLVDKFNDMTEKLSVAKNLDEIADLQNQISYLTAETAWIRCTDLLQNFVKTSIVNSTFVSKECPFPRDSLDWTIDPCCNPVLEDIKCCAPRQVTISRELPSGVDGDAVVRQCAVADSAIPALATLASSFVTSLIQSTDPNTGCVASTLRQTGGIQLSDIWKVKDKYASFLRDCEKEVFGSNFFSPCSFTSATSGLEGGKDCVSDADCYTSCVSAGDSKKCVVPWGNPTPYLEKCYLNKMDPSLRASVMRIWGLYDPKDLGAFEREFRNRTTRQKCAGPTSCRYNGGWMKPNCFYEDIPNPDLDYSYLWQYAWQPQDPSCPCKIEKPTDPTNPNCYKDCKYNQTIYGDLLTRNNYGMEKYLLYGDWEYDPGYVKYANLFYVQPSQSSCLAEKGCNWFRPEGVPCDLKEDGKPSYFCSQFYGGGAGRDLTVKGGCQLSVDVTYNWNDYSYDYATFNQSCTAIGGKMYVDPAAPRAFPVCYSDEKSYTECLATCKSANGPNPVPPKQCFNRDIHPDDCYRLQVTTEYGWNIGAWVQTLYLRSKGTNVMACAASAFNEGDCEKYFSDLGFTWTSLAQTEEEKGVQIEDTCGSNYCLMKDYTTSQDCWSMNLPQSDSLYVYNSWENNFNNGSGACLLQIYSKDYGSSWIPRAKAFCEQNGGSYYLGKRYNFPKFDTPESCAEGVCSWYEGLGKKECEAQQYCEGASCFSCQLRDYSASVKEVCTTPSLMNCTYNGGHEVVSGDTSFCLYKGDQLNSCTSMPNSQRIACASLPKRNCDQNDYSEFMQCSWLPKQCETKDECEAIGSCDDDELYLTRIDRGGLTRQEFEQLTRVEFNGTDWVPKNRGTCVLPGRLMEGGWRDCFVYADTLPNGKYPSWSKSGCTVSDLTIAECGNLGGTIQYPAFNKAECEARKGCVDSGKDEWSMSHKSPSECVKCGGRVQSVYNWRTAGRWTTGKMVPGVWAKREEKPLNSWTSVVDIKKFSEYVDQAISDILLSLYATEYRCKYAPFASYLKDIACICGKNADAKCLNQKQSELVLASSEISCNSDATINAAGMQMKVDQNSTVPCVKNTVVIGRVDAPLASSSNETKPVLLRKRAATSSSCYAYVKNSNDAYVGQIRGDCVIFRPSVAITNVELCLPMKTAIPWDSVSYPTSGVATKNDDGSFVLTSLSVFESSGRLCTRVSTSGTFCPVSIKAGASSLTTGSQPSCDTAATMLEAITAANAKLTAGATKLRIKTQPSSSVVAGTPLTSIEVEFLDANSQPVQDAEATVVLKLVTSTGASILGTGRSAALSGVSSFGDVAFDRAGTGYTLVASCGSLTPATTSSFAVIPAPPKAVMFTVQPGGAIVGQTFLQAPKVAVVDAYGNLISSSSARIDLSLSRLGSSASFTSAAATYSLTAVSGAATFTDITVGSALNGYVLVAQSTGLTAATSAKFNVVPNFGFAVKLAFESAISGAIAGSPFPTPAVVRVLDGQNALMSTYSTGTVTISIKMGSSDATLIGTRTLNIQSGKATFSNLGISLGGSGYVLEASADGLAATVSTPFQVSGLTSLTFLEQPPASTRTSFQVKVKLIDVDGALWNSNDFITLSIKTYTGTFGASLTGSVRLRAVNGVATFSGLSVDLPGQDYVLMATTDNNLSVESSAFTITSLNNQIVENDPTGPTVVDKIADQLGVSVGAVIGGVIGGLCVIAIGGFMFYKSKIGFSKG